MLRFLLVLFLAIAVVLLASAQSAHAHGMLSAYVEVIEVTPGTALVTVRAQMPVTGLHLAAEAPCVMSSETGAGAQTLSCPAAAASSVSGATLRVDGLGPILSEAVVFTKLADGTTGSTLATRDQPTCLLPIAGGHVSALNVARQYVRLGVTHIATGFDHLLFLLGLVLVLRRRVRAVLLAESAFTVSHSISFSASALGYVHVSSAAVEACIALSLVLVARDAMRPPRQQSSARQGAALAFVFGLVHGLGFAGGLTEIGVPQRAIPSALLGFACGVEIGQLAFLVLVLGLFWLASRIAKLPRLMTVAATYAVGIVGFYWLFERLSLLSY